MPPKPPLRIPKKPPPHPIAGSKAPASKPFPRSSPNKPGQPQPQSRRQPSPQLPPPPRSSRTRQLPSVPRVSSGAVFIVCAGFFVRDHFFCVDSVNGKSMAPTLSPKVHETGEKDQVLIQRHTNSGRNIKRGDVVTFWKPHRPNEIGIKRVVAVEGDTVYPQRGYALNAEVVRARRLGLFDGLGESVEGEEEETEVGKVVVPHGHVWVEGDNWRETFDSRDYGPISKGLIDGKAVRILRGWGWGWGKFPTGSLLSIGDEREEGRGSRVKEGTSKMPDRFLD